MNRIFVTALAPIIWGTTYFVTTEALPPDRPLLVGLLRALPAGLLLAMLSSARPRGAWWAKATVLGALNVGGFFALLFFAAYRLPGGVAATLGAVQPLVAAGLAAVLLRERLTASTIASALLGVVGVALLVVTSSVRLDPLGVAAGLAGAVSMATGIVLTKRWGRPVSLLAFTSWQLVAGGLFLVPFALALDPLPKSLTATNVFGFLWLGVVGTALAYALWFRGVQSLPVAQVAMLGLLSPLVAAFVGWALLGQSLTPWQTMGAVIVLATVGVTARRPARGVRRRAPPPSFVSVRRSSA